MTVSLPIFRLPSCEEQVHRRVTRPKRPTQRTTRYIHNKVEAGVGVAKGVARVRWVWLRVCE